MNVFEFLYLLLLLQLVVFHGAADIVGRFLRVEHVSAEVEDGLLVHNCVLVALILITTKSKASWLLTLFFFLGIEWVLDGVPSNEL